MRSLCTVRLYCEPYCRPYCEPGQAVPVYHTVYRAVTVFCRKQTPDPHHLLLTSLSSLSCSCAACSGWLADLSIAWNSRHLVCSALKKLPCGSSARACSCRTGRAKTQSWEPVSWQDCLTDNTCGCVLSCVAVEMCAKHDACTALVHTAMQGPCCGS